ncbi:MAG: D-alanyl-D-alanine carboxypeptidase [Clostridiales bacterium]|nr:D-alanyl-D-alanine carboxypeptidase [Clostridiales bacterium]
MKEENDDSETHSPPKIKLSALSALLMDAENNRVLYEYNGYQEMPMASTTKIMTCIIALEKGNLEDVVTVSSYASQMPDVQLNVREGEQYYLKDLLYSLMLESHNDTAVAIAEHVGGTVEGFATMMNDKARSLGCHNTNFVTPNGLDAEGHYTTARDLAVITSYAIRNKAFLEITNTASHQFSEIKSGRRFSVSNKNKFLYMMDGAIGVKTGFTGKAGYCFVGALKRPDRTLISVVLGCGWPPKKNLKWTDTVRLMTYGVDNYEKKQIFEKKEFPPVYVKNGQTSHVNLTVEGDLSILLRKDEKVKVEYDVPDMLYAPVDEGMTVGSARYYIDGRLYTELPVRTTAGSKKIDLKFCFMRILRLWGMELSESLIR